jgi:hypothetical protein
MTLWRGHFARRAGTPAGALVSPAAPNTYFRSKYDIPPIPFALFLRYHKIRRVLPK